MTQKADFAAAVTGLLRQLDMKIPAQAVLADEVYTISTGKVDIELAGRADGRIDLFCFPGQLKKLHLDSLATLLLANRYQHAWPPILTSLVGQTSPPKILLWSSIGAAEAEANPAALADVFIRMAEAADHMQSWLDGSLPAPQGKEWTSEHIEWLKKQAMPARIR